MSPETHHSTRADANRNTQTGARVLLPPTVEPPPDDEAPVTGNGRPAADSGRPAAVRVGVTADREEAATDHGKGHEEAAAEREGVTTDHEEVAADHARPATDGAIADLQSVIGYPKRKYTPSEKSREASRRNLALARQVWAVLRTQPGFKPGKLQEGATYRNLVRAVAHNLVDCSYRYARCFRHGMSAVSLERSLALAGEKLADYRAHVAWCVAALGAGFGAASEVAKLARALAYASWRRIRGLRELAEWEFLTLCELLRRCALLRRRGVDTGAEGLATVIGFVRGTLGEQFFLIPKVKRAANRVAALAAKLIEERGGTPPRWCARRSAVVDRSHLLPAEAISNPFVSPEKVLAALERRQARVKPPEEWQPWQPGGSVKASDDAVDDEYSLTREGGMLCRARALEAAGRLHLPSTFEEFLELVKDAVGEAPDCAPQDPARRADDETSGSSGVFGDAASAAQAQPQTPVSDQELVLEAARAIWARLEIYRAQAGQEAEALRDLREDYPAEDYRGAEPDGSEGESSSLGGQDGLADDDTSSLDGGEDEIAGLFPAAGGADAADSGSDPCSLARYLAAELVSIDGVLREAKAAEYRLNCALYRLLINRYGERPEFLELKPAPPDYTPMLIAAMMMNAHGNAAGARELMAEYYKLEAMAKEYILPGPAPG